MHENGRAVLFSSFYRAVQLFPPLRLQLTSRIRFACMSYEEEIQVMRMRVSVFVSARFPVFRRLMSSEPPALFSLNFV